MRKFIGSLITVVIIVCVGFAVVRAVSAKDEDVQTLEKHSVEAYNYISNLNSFQITPAVVKEVHIQMGTVKLAYSMLDPKVAREYKICDTAASEVTNGLNSGSQSMIVNGVKHLHECVELF